MLSAVGVWRASLGEAVCPGSPLRGGASLAPPCMSVSVDAGLVLRGSIGVASGGLAALPRCTSAELVCFWGVWL